MVKIEYDLNNSEHCEMINDYFYIKYFFECLVNDWYMKFLEAHKRYVDTDVIDILQIIIEHINKYELNFALEILFKYEIMNIDRGKEADEYIYALLWHHKFILKNYKQMIIFNFGKK